MRAAIIAMNQFQLQVLFPELLGQETAKIESTCHLSTTREWNSPHYPLNAERQAEKLWMPILKTLVWLDTVIEPVVYHLRGRRSIHSANSGFSDEFSCF